MNCNFISKMFVIHCLLSQKYYIKLKLKISNQFTNRLFQRLKLLKKILI